jgi:protein-S-isoprenylcysteine O-methyltransferase Ste14
MSDLPGDPSPWALRTRQAAALWPGALAAGTVGWWLAMLALPWLRPHFIPAALGDQALWAFALGDPLLIIAPSLYTAARLPHDREQARWAAWLVTGALGYSALVALAASLATWQAPLGAALMLGCAFTQAVIAWTMQPADRWFRVAEPASDAARALRTVADAALFSGIFLVAVPALLRLFEDSYGLPRVTPLAPWACGAAIALLNLGGLGSGLWMVRAGGGTPLPVDTAATLVVSGPYAWVRNPMAALGIAQGALLALALGSPLTLAYAVFGGLFWHGFVRPIEEEDLVRRFGAPYAVYARAVPLWLPRWTAWRG